MEQKSILPVLVIKKDFYTNLAQLQSTVADWPQKMVSEIALSGLEVSGPQIWVYQWDELKPEANFKLEVCIPVKTPTKSHHEHRQTKKLNAFKCIEAVHYGPWSNLVTTYQTILTHAQTHGISLGKTCREVYTVCDFINQDNNITMVQFEIIN